MKLWLTIGLSLLLGVGQGILTAQVICEGEQGSACCCAACPPTQCCDPGNEAPERAPFLPARVAVENDLKPIPPIVSMPVLGPAPAAARAIPETRPFFLAAVPLYERNCSYLL